MYVLHDKKTRLALVTTFFLASLLAYSSEENSISKSALCSDKKTPSELVSSFFLAKLKRCSTSTLSTRGTHFSSVCSPQTTTRISGASSMAPQRHQAIWSSSSSMLSTRSISSLASGPNCLPQSSTTMRLGSHAATLNSSGASSSSSKGSGGTATVLPFWPSTMIHSAGLVHTLPVAGSDWFLKYERLKSRV